jgi:phosphoribosylaminoimidazole (AIR) synthetase
MSRCVPTEFRLAIEELSWKPLKLLPQAMNLDKSTMHEAFQRAVAVLSIVSQSRDEKSTTHMLQ